MGRSARKLSELWIADAAILAEALRGSDAVYTLLPTDRCSRDYRGRQGQEGEGSGSL